MKSYGSIQQEHGQLTVPMPFAHGKIKISPNSFSFVTCWIFYILQCIFKQFHNSFIIVASVTKEIIEKWHFSRFRTGIPEKSVGIGFVNPKMSAIAAIILLREFSPRPLLK